MTDFTLIKTAAEHAIRARGTLLADAAQSNYDGLVTPESVLELACALETYDKLITERDRLVNAIPACPIHGPCIPHAIEWVEKAVLVMRELKAENDKLRAERDRLAADNLALLESPGDAV